MVNLTLKILNHKSDYCSDSLISPLILNSLTCLTGFISLEKEKKEGKKRKGDSSLAASVPPRVRRRLPTLPLSQYHRRDEV